MLALLLLLGCDPSLPGEDRAGEPGVLDEATARGVTARSIRSEGASSTRIEVELQSGDTIVVVDRHNPDRVALSEDGAHVAWVDGRTGLASVFVAPVQPDAPATQVTNAGLVPTPGRAPEGWVPPPRDDSLRFDGDWLVWDGPDGPIRAEWR